MASSPFTRARMPARSGRGHGLVPEAEGADEGVRVRAQPRVRRQLLQQLRIPPAEHDVVGLERFAQQLDGLSHRLAPALLAEPLAAALADVVLKGCLAIGKVLYLERLHRVSVDERRAEPRPEAEEEHLASLVAAECLHCRVVDDLRRLAKGLFEVEAGPAWA